MTPKRRLSDLAALGGAPAFPDALHVGRPTIPDRARLTASITDILGRNRLTNNGPCVREIERRLADLLGVKHCIATSSGTIALQLTIRATGLRGEALVPSFTFVATAHALQWEGVTPVFCDVDPGTHTIDPRCLEAAITPRTSGIVGVHIWGRPCDVEALKEIAQRHHLTLLFDAAHAFRCSHGGRMIGGFGVAEVFSFHATKFFHTLEGGAVTTNDDDLATKLRRMRDFGFAGVDQVVALGINGKMNEVSAAVGLTLWDRLDELVAVNRRNHLQYRQGLAGLPGLTVVGYDPSEASNYQYVVVEVEEAQAQLRRDDLLRVLQAENVIARRYFYPGCHRMEPYRSAAVHGARALPETDALVERVLCLPTGEAVGAEDIDTVCQIVALALSDAPAVRRQLAHVSAG
jgi:dTDP-4-amino-4,6-dideoxygalactose transaminase